tara:strand:+ start:634 stop:852 length:219 start_codon:yes stop_codon:yes gene_type:complete
MTSRNNYGYPKLEEVEITPAQKEELRFLKKVMDNAMEDYMRDNNPETKEAYTRKREDLQMFVAKLRRKGIIL